MYRVWAPWDAVGVRSELLALLASKAVSPQTHPRAIDLGCGTGANVVHLAQEGFDVTGVDFSPVALGKARERARAANASCRFVEADLTSSPLRRVEGTFDLLLDFGTLDDLPPTGRRAMAANMAALARPGARALFWCFYGPKTDLPLNPFKVPSRLTAVVEPVEVGMLFGDAFAIEPFMPEKWSPHIACFLLTRHG